MFTQIVKRVVYHNGPRQIVNEDLSGVFQEDV